MLDEALAWLLPHAGLAALVLARTAGAAWTAPALATPGLSPRFRLVLAIALTATVAPSVAAMGIEAPKASLSTIGAACLFEAIIGAALGWSAALIVAGARQAGELVAAQAGFSAASLFDPEAGDELSAIGHLYGLAALGVFLALDGPLTLVRTLAESYRVVPPGVATLASVEFAFGRVGLALELALRASAPVAVALALAGLALGLIGRATPSLHRAALIMPVRTILGLFLLFLGLSTLVASLGSAWTGWPGSEFAHVGG